MTAEVDWVLSQFASVVTSVGKDYTLQNGDAVTLKRINRDESEILEGNIRDRKGELRQAAYVGATFADRAPTPIGTEYDHRVEAVVGVRIEGLHHSEFGHVDPDGTNGIPFDELVRRLRDALLAERTFPNVGSPDATYTDLQITNEAPQSSDYQDYYRHDFDVLFRGYEDLP